MIDLAWDNDVLIKTSIYQNGQGILDRRDAASPNAEQLVLVTAKWVATKSLQKRIRRGDAPGAAASHLDEMFSRMVEVEPTGDELQLATALEEEALEQDVALDSGESLLAAICIVRGGVLLTGDKRAMLALQHLQATRGSLSPLRSRVACLEQAIGTVIQFGNGHAVRSAICSWPTGDRALTMAMECSLPQVYFSADGLHSYVDSLRRLASDMLAPGYVLPD